MRPAPPLRSGLESKGRPAGRGASSLLPPSVSLVAQSSPLWTKPSRCLLKRWRPGLALRLLADLAPLADLGPFQLRRRAIEHEHRTNVVVHDQARGSEHEAVEVGGDPTPGILQWRPIPSAHNRQKLVQFQIPIDRNRAAVKRLERRRMADDDGCEEDAHQASTPRRPLTFAAGPWKGGYGRDT